jgi:hypothetical protein
MFTDCTYGTVLAKTTRMDFLHSKLQPAPSDSGTTTASKLMTFALNTLGEPLFNHIHGNVWEYLTFFVGDTPYQIRTQLSYYGSGQGNLVIVWVMLQY